MLIIFKSYIVIFIPWNQNTFKKKRINIAIFISYSFFFLFLVPYFTVCKSGFEAQFLCLKNQPWLIQHASTACRGWGHACRVTSLAPSLFLSLASGAKPGTTDRIWGWGSTFGWYDPILCERWCQCHSQGTGLCQPSTWPAKPSTIPFPCKQYWADRGWGCTSRVPSLALSATDAVKHQA